MTPRKRSPSCARVPGGQLDTELVESFVAMLEREGPRSPQDADFETELEFERRVREMAEPARPTAYLTSRSLPAVESPSRNWGSALDRGNVL